MAKRETQVGPRLELADPRKARSSSRSPPSPEEGRRLVHAFMGIKDAAIRDAIVGLIETMSRTYNGVE
jgi:hypothetical protein